MNNIEVLLPAMLVSMTGSFDAQQLVDQLRPAPTEKEQVAGEVHDFLDDMVWMGVLWKTGHRYVIRSRPRGIAA